MDRGGAAVAFGDADGDYPLVPPVVGPDRTLDGLTAEGCILVAIRRFRDLPRSIRWLLPAGLPPAPAGPRPSWLRLGTATARNCSTLIFSDGKIFGGAGRQAGAGVVFELLRRRAASGQK